MRPHSASLAVWPQVNNTFLSGLLRKFKNYVTLLSYGSLPIMVVVNTITHKAMLMNTIDILE